MYFCNARRQAGLLLEYVRKMAETVKPHESLICDMVQSVFFSISLALSIFRSAKTRTEFSGMPLEQPQKNDKGCSAFHSLSRTGTACFDNCRQYIQSLFDGFLVGVRGGMERRIGQIVAALPEKRNRNLYGDASSIMAKTELPGAAFADKHITNSFIAGLNAKQRLFSSSSPRPNSSFAIVEETYFPCIKPKP